MDAVKRVEIVLHELLEAILNILQSSITGRLATRKQIESISVTSAGFGLRLILSNPAESELDLDSKISKARDYIKGASEIVDGLSQSLDARTKALEALAVMAQEKRREAEHFAAIAEANKATLVAFRSEIEAAIRAELETRAREGRWARRIASLIIWLINLVIGAALGTYFLYIVGWTAHAAGLH